MTIFISFCALLITVLLNSVFAKKIENKTYRIWMNLLNVALSLSFVILIVITGTVKKNLTSYIDLGINKLEMQVDEIYPGVLEKQMNTEEVKNILESCLERKHVNSLESLAENILKSAVKKYTSTALKIINTLERDTDKLSVKDALISIKEFCLNTATPWFKFLTILIVGLYIILIVVSIILSLHLSNNNDIKNKGKE
ncbi:MAG: hypothetical protein J6V90_04920 [Treponema sp.]|nr:hypothetical protein [Treponema sp.]